MWNYDEDWLRWIESREIGGVYHVWGEGVHARNFLRLTVAKTILKNDNTKTKRKRKRKYCQKREINENENTISLTKTITKTKIESKTKLILSVCFMLTFTLVWPSVDLIIWSIINPQRPAVRIRQGLYRPTSPAVERNTRARNCLRSWKVYSNHSLMDEV